MLVKFKKAGIFNLAFVDELASFRTARFDIVTLVTFIDTFINCLVIGAAVLLELSVLFEYLIVVTVVIIVFVEVLWSLSLSLSVMHA